MGILSAAKANAYRAKIERKALPDVCSVVRKARTQDATTGAWSESESTYASGIPCRVDKSGLSPREYALSDRFSAVSLYTISLSTVASRWPGGSVSVQASDRLIVTGEGAGTYEPVDSGGPVTDELLRELRANRVEEG
jgi:hypothetical protein